MELENIFFLQVIWKYLDKQCSVGAQSVQQFHAFSGLANEITWNSMETGHGLPSTVHFEKRVATCKSLCVLKPHARISAFFKNTKLLFFLAVI